METPGSAGSDQGKSVAFIITHTIKAGEEARYEAWLLDILNAVSRTPGYIGRDIFRPAHGGRTYTSILRFDTIDNLNAWAGSDTRREFVNRVGDLLTKGDAHHIRTGIDFWFTPEHVNPPKPWKQFLLVLSAIYPLTQIIPLVLTPLFAALPLLNHPLVRGLIIAAAVVGLMTFVIMPYYTRLVKRWLYDETEER